jgi:hypothetical protein
VCVKCICIYLPEQLVDEHAREDADEDADHGETEEGAQTRVERSVDDLAVWRVVEHEPHACKQPNYTLELKTFSGFAPRAESHRIYKRGESVTRMFISGKAKTLAPFSPDRKLVPLYSSQTHF